MAVNAELAPRRTSRRGFLKTMLAAGAAPYVIPAAALGRMGTVGPNSRVSVALIGVGNMGGGHLSTLLGHPQVQVTAVCDVDRGKRQSAAQRVNEHYSAARGMQDYAGCQAENEYERVLQREDIDAVLIAVPDHWHAAIAIAACRAGKDVYCEKPLSLTIVEAREMVRTARLHGTVFQVGSQQRSDRNFRFACELVRNGRIGTLQHVKANIGAPSGTRVFPEQPTPDGFDYERWLGPAPWQPYNAERVSGNYSGGWRLIRDYSGGMTTDWGAHHFDIAQWGIGADGSGPSEIHPPQPGGRGLTFVYYPGGVTLERSPDVNGVRFIGSDGQVEVNRGHLRTWPENLATTTIGPNEIRLYESPGHHEDWLRCIRTRQRPICDVATGASSVTVCHLGNIACWLNRPLRWDAQRGLLLDDDLAARWLDRPRRAPWRLYA